MPPPGGAPPALLNRQSSRPHLARQASNIAFTSASLVASVLRKTHLSLPSDASSERPSSSRRPVARTLAPSATKISTVRRPMPLVAPVTMVILPLSLLPSGLPMISPFFRTAMIHHRRQGAANDGSGDHRRQRHLSRGRAQERAMAARRLALRRNLGRVPV